MRNIKKTKGDNSGDYNSGDYNSGDWNCGNYNSGDKNFGDFNSGYRNTGDYNSGENNSGDYNTGDHNSGDSNTGDWNSCDRESGFLNTETSDTIRVFNKPCKLSEWEEAEIPAFFGFSLTEWVVDDAKAEGGYLKTYTLEEAWSKAWADAPEYDRKKVEELPNFDWAVFTELTGIKNPEEQDPPDLKDEIIEGLVKELAYCKDLLEKLREKIEDF
jgi:hypothetical protein